MFRCVDLPTSITINVEPKCTRTPDIVNGRHGDTFTDNDWRFDGGLLITIDFQDVEIASFPIEEAIDTLKLTADDHCHDSLDQYLSKLRGVVSGLEYLLDQVNEKLIEVEVDGSVRGVQ